jgi:phage tail sheath protein FI
MPATFTYPGIYVEEVPSDVHPIVGASTSDTAFVDYFGQGPVGIASRVTSLAELQRIYGPVDQDSEASYAVTSYFLNGGKVAWIVRVVPGFDPASPDDDMLASLTLTKTGPAADALVVRASSPGAWGAQVQVAATQTVPSDTNAFNLFVRQVVTTGTDTRVVAAESFRGLSATVGSASYAVDVVNAGSALITLDEPGDGVAKIPTLATPTPSGDPPDAAWRPLAAPATATAVIDTATGEATADFVTALTGAVTVSSSPLDHIDPFHINVLCVPATSRVDHGSRKALMDAVVAYATAKRAFAIIDPPPATEVGTTDKMRGWLLGSEAPAASPNGAVYFPTIQVNDPLAGGRSRELGPSGMMAGVYARTDAARGTWKAPAGIDATLAGGTLARPLNDADSAVLNPLGINALRTLPVIGSVAWGARTLVGADQRASEWKYVPVRRMALYIENSLVDGLGWVVFEPNDEPLWAQIRLNVGAFMQDLFRQGAFQGSTPRDAYLVKCDSTTTTQSDIDKGVVNILVGFAPLKPAEFVVIRIQQLAGQTQA